MFKHVYQSSCLLLKKAPPAICVHLQVRSLSSCPATPPTLMRFMSSSATERRLPRHVGLTLLLFPIALPPYTTPASRNNSASQADYKGTPKSPLMGPPPPVTPGGGNTNGGMPFKPVPPPKPKNYRPPMQNGMNDQPHWENGMVRLPVNLKKPMNANR